MSSFTPFRFRLGLLFTALIRPVQSDNLPCPCGFRFRDADDTHPLTCTGAGFASSRWTVIARYNRLRDILGGILKSRGFFVEYEPKAHNCIDERRADLLAVRNGLSTSIGVSLNDCDCSHVSRLSCLG